MCFASGTPSASTRDKSYSCPPEHAELYATPLAHAFTQCHCFSETKRHTWDNHMRRGAYAHKCARCERMVEDKQRPSRCYCSLRCQILSKCVGTEEPDGCWVWTGAKRGNGYGIARLFLGGRYRMITPSRIMYAIENGSVEYTRSVLNTCGTKNCCNPRHLRQGVQEMPVIVTEASPG